MDDPRARLPALATRSDGGILAERVVSGQTYRGTCRNYVLAAHLLFGALARAHGRDDQHLIPLVARLSAGPDLHGWSCLFRRDDSRLVVADFSRADVAFEIGTCDSIWNVNLDASDRRNASALAATIMTAYSFLHDDRRGAPLGRLFAALAGREPSELLLGLVERGYLHPKARARIVRHLECNPPRRADWKASLEQTSDLLGARLLNLRAQEELLAPLLGC